MVFTIEFIQLFFYYLAFTTPLMGFFLLSIVVLGQCVGRIESWNWFDALYWSMITALTIGYGDIRPIRRVSRILSIVIGLIGIIMTGILVAIAVATAKEAFANVQTLINV